MINKLAKQAYENSKSKGFYEDYDNLVTLLQDYQQDTAYVVTEHLEYLKQVSTAQKIALIQSEASEMLESDRKDKECGLIGLEVDFIRREDDDTEFQKLFRDFIKDTKEDELADIMIRCLDYAGREGIDLEAHILAKMRYNSLRPHKHGKNY